MSNNQNPSSPSSFSSIQRITQGRIRIPKTPLPPWIHNKKEDSSSTTTHRKKNNSPKIQAFPGETEEGAIVRTFMNILRFKAQWMTSEKSIMDTLDTIIRSPSYVTERQCITDINNKDVGLWKGIAVGIGTFVFLRMGPRFITRTLFQQQQPGAQQHSTPSPPGYNNNTSFGSIPLDRNPYSTNQYSPSTTISSSSSSSNIKVTTPGQSLNTTGSSNNNNSSSSSSSDGSIVWKLVKLGLDSFISLSMAAYTSFYFMDTSSIISSITKIPLIQGKSLISEILCDDFITLYTSILSPKKWKQYTTTTTLHDPIQSLTNGSSSSGGGNKKTNLMFIQDFTWNCIKRQTYEKELLSLQKTVISSDDQEDDDNNNNNNTIKLQLEKDHDHNHDPVEDDDNTRDGKWLGSSLVEIPYPGVPVDLDFVIPWINVGNSNDDDDEEEEEEDFFGEDSSF